MLMMMATAMVVMVTWRWSLRSSWTSCTSSLVFDVSPFSGISPTTLGFSVLGSLQGHFPSLHKSFPLLSDMFKTITIDDQAMVCSKLVFETLNILSTVTSLHINSKIDSVFKIFKKEIQFINFAHLTRFVRVHDLPGLLAAALQNQPWRRNG